MKKTVEETLTTAEVRARNQALKYAAGYLASLIGREADRWLEGVEFDLRGEALVVSCPNHRSQARLKFHKFWFLLEMKKRLGVTSVVFKNRDHANQAAKRPAASTLKHMRSLLGGNGEASVLDQVTCTVTGESQLKLVCHDDGTYRRLKACEAQLTPEFLTGVGLAGVTVQYDLKFLVLKTIRALTTPDQPEFTADQVAEAVNRIPPGRTKEAIKVALRELSNDLSRQQGGSDKEPTWWLDLRGTAPLVIKLDRERYRLAAKAKSAPKPARKLKPLSG